MSPPKLTSFDVLGDRANCRLAYRENGLDGCLVALLEMAGEIVGASELLFLIAEEAGPYCMKYEC